ncbi:MAG: hypothetical protein E6J43_02325 [Chloroflexi bacterium]|nr:MAG: hypothetical protein E6J43_02325 [Chloroflexota bacterium]
MTVINVILSDDHLLGRFTSLREGIWGRAIAASRRTWSHLRPVRREPEVVRAEPVEASAQRQRILSPSKEERAQPADLRRRSTVA